jgi:hypothetical protein
VASVSHLGPTYLGLDVHKDTISVAILAPDRDRPDEVVALSLIPKAPATRSRCQSRSIGRLSSSWSDVGQPLDRSPISDAAVSHREAASRG